MSLAHGDQVGLQCLIVPFSGHSHLIVIFIPCFVLLFSVLYEDSFVDLFIVCLSLLNCLVCVVQTCGHLLERLDFFVLLYAMFSFAFVTFPYGSLDQV